MPAKSLGTLATIYATDELQHPFPHYTMLSEADMNNPTGRSDARAHSYASPLSTQHCLKGEGFNSRIAVAWKGKESEIPKNVSQVLLAGIVGVILLSAKLL